MKKAQEILEKHLEIAKNPSQWDEDSIKNKIYEPFTKAMEEYAELQVKFFNRLPNGSNLLVSPNEVLRVAFAFAEWLGVNNFEAFTRGGIFEKWSKEEYENEDGGFSKFFTTEELYEKFKSAKANGG